MLARRCVLTSKAHTSLRPVYAAKAKLLYYRRLMQQNENYILLQTFSCRGRIVFDTVSLQNIQFIIVFHLAPGAILNSLDSPEN